MIIQELDNMVNFTFGVVKFCPSKVDIKKQQRVTRANMRLHSPQTPQKTVKTRPLTYIYLDCAQEIPALHKTQNGQKHVYILPRMLLNIYNTFDAFCVENLT